MAKAPRVLGRTEKAEADAIIPGLPKSLSIPMRCTLDALKDEENGLSHNALAERTGCAKGNKLRILESFGYVNVAKSGGKYTYIITPEGEAALEASGTPDDEGTPRLSVQNTLADDLATINRCRGSIGGFPSEFARDRSTRPSRRPIDTRPRGTKHEAALGMDRWLLRHRPRPDVVEQDHPNRRRRRVFLVRNAGGLMEAITKPGVPQEGDPHPDNELHRVHASRPGPPTPTASSGR